MSLIATTAVLAGVLIAFHLVRSRRRRRPIGKAPPRRKAPPRADDISSRIDAFWEWWRTAAPRLAADLDAGRTASCAAEISSKVEELDPRLAWDTGQGLGSARHHLALSGEGDLALRVTTERWLSRAPAADEDWEYYPARQPVWAGSALSLELEELPGVRFDWDGFRVRTETETRRELVHVVLHHPAFAAAPEESRTRVALLTLDNLLGEDGVEKWIGSIDTSVAPLPEGKTLEELTTAVKGLAATATGERFAILEGRMENGRPIVSTVNLALKRVDHLLMDLHLAVTVPLQHPTSHGLTTNEEAAALNTLEDELFAVLAHDAVYIGRETCDGLRTMHFHAATAGPAEGRAREWMRRHPKRRIRLEVEYDPTWTVLRRW